MGHTHRRVVMESIESRRMMSTVSVTTLADSGAGSLRQALLDAQPGDTVSLNGVSGTINLTTGLALSQNVSITRTGSGAVTVTTNHTDRGFYVNPGLTVAMSGFTIADSGNRTMDGGGIYNDNAQLTLTKMTIADNQGESMGGGIYSSGVAVVNDSTISGNSLVATGEIMYGGGIAITANNSATFTGSGDLFIGNTITATVDTNMMMPVAAFGGGLGAFYGADTVSVSNSTFTGNAVLVNGSMGDAAGGAILLSTVNPSTIDHTTIVGNTSAGDNNRAGGVYQFANTVTISDSIIVGNTSDIAPETQNAAAGPNNLIGDGTDSGFTDGVDGNIVGTAGNPADPMLSALADNGGPTETLALQAGSPAIDAAAGSTATVDQRGIARDAMPDIGAFEYVAPVVPVTPVTPYAGPVTLTSGTLSVTGTAAADAIHVFVPTGHADTVRVAMNGRLWNFAEVNVSGVTIHSGDGDDTVVSNAPALASYIFGGNGNDSLTGGSAGDTISGGAGDDVLYGMGGDDLLNGFGGRDHLFGGDGADRILGGTGSNWLQGDAGSDTLIGTGVDTFAARDNTADRIEAGTLAGSTAITDALDTLTGTVTPA